MALDKSESDNGWTEPESAASAENPPVYPYNHATKTESGHVFELDDTLSRERVRLSHRSKTFLEMHPNGDEVHKIVGDGYEIIAKNSNVLIKGVCNITINGDSIVHVKGNKIERIDGDYKQEILGNFTQVVKKCSKIMSECDMSLGANAGFGGALRIATGDHIYLEGDLHIGGELTADKITANTRVDAGTGVSAGKLGFVSMFGGLSLGIPIAIPGCIYTLGTIDSVISVNAPLGNFGIMDSILMTDIVNTSIYDAHIHPAPEGMTGPPILKMI